MPVYINWTIDPAFHLDGQHHGAQHSLHIRLKPEAIRKGLAEPPHNLEIIFPTGPTIGPFTTKWFNSPLDFKAFPDDWGHESDPSLGRVYRLSYMELVKEISWDRRSAIELLVCAPQQRAWRPGIGSTEFIFEGVSIRPPVDGKICVAVPKATGRWGQWCEELLFHLNQTPFTIAGSHFPCQYAEDWPSEDKLRYEVNFSLTSSRLMDKTKLKVTCSTCWLYEWLTSKKITLVAIAFLFTGFAYIKLLLDIIGAIRKMF